MRADEYLSSLLADRGDDDLDHLVYVPTKGGWDQVSNPIGWKDSLCFGANGSGYETLLRTHSSLKEAFCDAKNLPGFRADSLYPYQWYIDMNKLHYESTAPWNRSCVWYSFGDNLIDLLMHPFAYIYFIDVQSDVLEQRVIEYRKKKKVKDGRTDSDVVKSMIAQNVAFKDQFEHIKGLRSSEDNTIFLTVDGSKTPSEIVTLIDNLSRYVSANSLASPKMMDYRKSKLKG